MNAVGAGLPDQRLQIAHHLFNCFASFGKQLLKFGVIVDEDEHGGQGLARLLVIAEQVRRAIVTQLPLPLLFVFGFLLVTVQSLVDVVFLVAMVEMGTRELPLVGTAVAVATYTLAALALQMIVVVVYQLLSADRRDAALARFNAYLDSHGELVAGVLTLVLGVVLAGISVHELLNNV